jgi:hypothetical protein
MLAVATPGTLLVLFFGMLPTGVAFIVDPSRGKYAASSVGAMNFAAVFPILFDLWLHGHSVGAAGVALTDAFAMTVIYAAAAFGWSLHLGIPAIAIAIRRVTSVTKIDRLRIRQQQLIDAWGEEVAQLPTPCLSEPGAPGSSHAAHEVSRPAAAP